jgi:hypothetical protein
MESDLVFGELETYNYCFIYEAYSYLLLTKRGISLISRDRGTFGDILRIYI